MATDVSTPSDQLTIAVQTAVRISELPRQTIYDAAHRKEFDVIRKGKRIMIDRASFIAWMEKDRIPADADVA